MPAALSLQILEMTESPMPPVRMLVVSLDRVLRRTLALLFQRAGYVWRKPTRKQWEL